MDKRDVIVVGAGPGGTAAAIAAARAGCRVLLVEKHGFAGGMATAGLVNPFLGSHYRNAETGRHGDLIRGIYAEICDQLRRRGALLRFRYSQRDDAPFSDAFDDAWLRIIYDQMLGQAGVQMLYHSTLLDARLADERIEAIRVLTKSGVEELSASTFIDATGDGDLAASCGARCRIGRDSDGLCQPCSTMFRMGGVDKGHLLAGGLGEARRIINDCLGKARRHGTLHHPLDKLNVYEFPRPGVLHFNATRVTGRPALDSVERTRVEIEGRRQVAALADWLRAEVPGFQHSFIESIATHAGVRETRRVVGRHVLSRDQILAGERFADGIARSGYFIDIHAPTAGERDGHVGQSEGFMPNRYYEIPLRCLQPATVGNMLIACRAISTDHYAHAATRVMGTLTAVGEGAGLAAGLAKRRGVDVGQIDGPEVRAALGYLDQPLDF